jgi:hypothetical protein
LKLLIYCNLGTWVSPSKRGNITKIPLRRTALQEMQYTQLITGYISSFFKKKEGTNCSDDLFYLFEIPNLFR